jgi:histidyl-tRNA synthetase
MGVERLVLMKGEALVQPPRLELFLAAIGDEAARRVFILMSSLQRRGHRAEMDYEGKSLKSQLRRADKLRACHVLILGEDEIARQAALFKDMDAGTQEEIPLAGLEELLLERLRRL